MRGSISKITMALVLIGGCWAAAGCAGDDGGTPDGGGGSGGSGGSSPSMDAGGDSGLVGCVSEAPTACPDPPVTYSKVEPIFQARCVSVCHNDRTIDPNTNLPIWGFTDYEHVVTWKTTIQPEVLRCSMPPVDAGVRITVEERRAILDWILCGVPR
ncbi:MAG TPA: hypothetical protein VK540_13285 [Polyangiaceae bacterium]|jgi:hypothetical protein|nr:hypothetical protein [Polyangiaceae bacterium]